MKRDQVFAKKRKKVMPFEFNEKVAEVFDNMVNRSVPFYAEIHRMILDVARLNLPKKAVIVDLGCSTASTLILLDQLANQKKYQWHLIGVDNSASMLKRAHQKLMKNDVPSFELILSNLQHYKIPKSDLIIMNYTMQFLAPRDRNQLLKRISQALNPGGILIVSEKIKSTNKKVEGLTTGLYYDFKRRNGYSELEIAQKREALESVLRPWTVDQNLALLNKAGLKNTACLFQWYNFASFIAFK